MIFLGVSLLPAQTDIRRQVLSDKVERCYRPKTAGQEPWFFQQVENLFNVMLPPKDQLPFGVSVAFLVGVSQYDYLPQQLPFVKNDLRDMREFLLNPGGFDTVYVATERIVNRDLIDDHMRNRFAWLDPRDRLLFYFAGHGADNAGNAGYMQFAQARPNNFVGPQVLSINVTTDWSSESRVRHMVFLFDCCSSGLAFAPRGDFVFEKIAVLSRDPSRIALTAGTAGQQTFEVGGNGVFTRAFLNAAKIGLTDQGNDGFITIDEIFAYIKDEVATFAARSKKPLTPQPWQLLDRAKYRGTFVFVNPEAKSRNLTLSEQYAQVLNAQPRGPVAAVGIIQITSYLTGQVYLDNAYMGEVENGDVREYENVKTGSHTITVQSAIKTVTKTVVVTKGQLIAVTLRPQRPTPIIQPSLENNPITPRYSLRHEAQTNLSETAVKSMLRQKDFYCTDVPSYSKAYGNPQGKGFPNDFEVQQGGKVVFDRATGLMRQQSAPKYMNYEKAKAYVVQLNRDYFAGYNDWRLPTLEEAMSLMEPKKLNGDLYIDPKFDKTQRWIWTADMYNASAAWVVLFRYGSCDHYGVGWGSLRVCAVRSGQ